MAGGLEVGHPVKGAEPIWQKKNEEVVEQEFQKDLEVSTKYIVLKVLNAHVHVRCHVRVAVCILSDTMYPLLD